MQKKKKNRRPKLERRKTNPAATLIAADPRFLPFALFFFFCFSSPYAACPFAPQSATANRIV